MRDRNKSVQFLLLYMMCTEPLFFSAILSAGMSLGVSIVFREQALFLVIPGLILTLILLIINMYNMDRNPRELVVDLLRR